MRIYRLGVENCSCFCFQESYSSLKLICEYVNNDIIVIISDQSHLYTEISLKYMPHDIVCNQASEFGYPRIFNLSGSDCECMQ